MEDWLRHSVVYLTVQQMLPLSCWRFRGQKCYVYVCCMFVWRDYLYSIHIHYIHIYTFIFIFIYIYIYIYIPLLFTFITLQNISFADTPALSPYNTIANYILVRLGKNLLVLFSKYSDHLHCVSFLLGEQGVWRLRTSRCVPIHGCF